MKPDNRRMTSTSNNHVLEPLMRPSSVVVLGASPREGSLGNTVVRNLLGYGFQGRIFPIHPSAGEVCNLPAFTGFDQIPRDPDCAVVCLSADKVVPALEEGSQHGLRAAVILASGFAESGPEGKARQQALIELAERTGMKICGPNCLGLANIGDATSLYSAALPETLEAGDVAVLSHSGSGCIALSNLGRFGVSHLVSMGNGAVVDVEHYLDFLADDDATRLAALFIETIRDPEAFAAAAKKMREKGKPVIALKVGRSEKGAAATAAHTGSLSGSGAVYDAFFRECGVVAVDDLDELIESIVLMRSVTIKPEGDGVAVLNVSGGEIALTCDVAQQVGLSLAQISEQTRQELKSILPPFATPANPLDVTGVAVFDMKMYGACISAIAKDPSVSLVAVSQDCPAALGASQAETYRNMAETVAAIAPTLPKPVVFYSNVAGGHHPRVAEPLNQAGVALLQGSRPSLLAMRRFLENASGHVHPVQRPDRLDADPKWQKRFSTGEAFTERESKAFLAENGIRVTREALAATPAEACEIAENFGYPLVAKIDSPDIPHKSDIGGVEINITTSDDLRIKADRILQNAKRHKPEAKINGVLVQEMVTGGIEAFVGVNRVDPFGMAIVVGVGGVLVELLHDTALALCPVSPSQALELFDRTRLGTLLDGFRGAGPFDRQALAELVSRLSVLAVTYADQLQSIDLNPVHVGSDGVCAVDALVILQTNPGETV